MTAVISGDTGIDMVQDNVITTADLQNGAVTAAKLSGAQTGSAPIYGCRAWCVFNGATGTILSSGNVTSVTRNSVGQYTIVFTTVMPDANYATVIGSNANLCNYGGTYTASTCTLSCATYLGAATDPTICSVAIFR